MEMLPGFILFPSNNGQQPKLVPCFVPKEHVQLADLPDILQSSSTPPPRKQPNHLKIQFERWEEEDGTTKHESLNNPEVKENDLLPEFFLRLQMKEELRTVDTANGKRKVITIILCNCENKEYPMTAWGVSAERLAGLEEGLLYKWKGIKALNNSDFTASDLEYRFGFGPRSNVTLVKEDGDE